MTTERCPSCPHGFHAGWCDQLATVDGRQVPCPCYIKAATGYTPTVWCGCGDAIPPAELRCATCRMTDEDTGAVDALRDAVDAYRADPVNAADRPDSWAKLDALLAAADAVTGHTGGPDIARAAVPPPVHRRPVTPW